MGETHFRLAEEACNRCDYERALAEYTQSILIDPHRVEAFARRGDVLKALGRHEAAIADYTAYLAIHPEAANVLAARGQLYAFTDRHREAIADYSTAISLSPTTASAYLGRGQSLVRVGDPSAAAEDLARAIELAPGNALASLERGSVMLQLGDPQTAVVELSRAIQLNPFLWAALARRAEAHEKLGRLDSAAADLSEALRLDSSNPSLLVARGKLRLRMSAMPQAIEDFEEAARYSTGNATLQASLAEAFLQAGRFDLAEEGLTQALRLQPDSPTWLKARGEARFQRKDLDGALADFVEVTRRDPRNASAQLGVAQVYIARSDTNLAIPYLNRAIELDPSLAEAYACRARCLSSPDETAALADATRAIELQPDAPAYRLLRAEFHVLAERHDEAAEDLAHALRHDRDEPKIYFLRARSEFHRGRLDAAIADYTHALRIQPTYTAALVDRALVYRAQRRHREALSDLSVAVQQDASHAVEFLVQTGLVNGAEGHFAQAMANFSVALKLDPENRAAIRGRQLVSERRDSQSSFETELPRLSPRRSSSSGEMNGRSSSSNGSHAAIQTAPQDHVSGPSVAAPAAEPEVDLAVEPSPLEEDTSFVLSPDLPAEEEPVAEAPRKAQTLQILAPPARRTPVAKAVATRRGSPKATLLKAKPLSRLKPARPKPVASKPSAETSEFQPTGTTRFPSLDEEKEANEREYTAEQARLAELKKKAEEAKRKADEEKKNKNKTKSSVKQELSEEEEEELKLRKRKRIKMIAACAALLFLTLFWTWDLVASLIPSGPAKMTEYDAVMLAQDYTANPSGFQEQYMEEEKPLVIQGTLISKTSGSGKRYFLDNAAAQDKRIEVLFRDPDEEPKEDSGAAPVKVLGVLARARQGGFLEMRGATLALGNILTTPPVKK